MNTQATDNRTRITPKALPGAWMIAVLTGSLWLLSGCATLFPEMSCEEFRKVSKETDYSTRYRLLDSKAEKVGHSVKPLPRTAMAAVHHYQVRVDPSESKTCTNIRVHKEVHLLRKNISDLVLEEVREFYTAEGVLIASKSETVSNQLSSSGYYAGTMPLPIPEKAPPGKYRIVSKLMVKKTNSAAPTVLARASAHFQVLARN